MNTIKNKKQGFSLIEVIVAVAILAVLSMPILLYFTNAAVHSAQGKHEQAADVAVQSVIEEIDAVTDFKSLEERLVDGTNGWAYVSNGGGAASPTPATDTTAPAGTVAPSGTTGPSDPNNSIAADVNGKTYLKRPISIDYDGNGTKNFIAKVEVDYSAYKASADAKIGSKFNSYNNPHLSEVYNDNNVIISEADESVSGVYALFQDLNGSNSNSSVTTSLSDLRSGASRAFEISIKKASTDVNDKMCFVKGGYRFSYPSANDQHVVIKEMKMSLDDLSNIYFLFKPMESTNSHHDTADVYFDFDASIDSEILKKIAVTFVRQKTGVKFEDAYAATSAPTEEPDGSDPDPSNPGGGGDPAVPPATVTTAPTPLVISINEAPDPTTQKITMTVASGSTSNWQNIHIFANGNVVFTNARVEDTKTDEQKKLANAQAEDGTYLDDGNLWMVYSPNEKRIAKITVSVYAAETYTDDTTAVPLASAVTTKTI